MVSYFDKLRLLKDTGKEYRRKMKFGDMEISKESAERFLSDPVASVFTDASKKKAYQVAVRLKKSSRIHLYDFDDIDQAYAYRDIVNKAISADPAKYIKLDKYLILNACAFEPTKTSVTVDDFSKGS